ncbi:MAG: pseudouridine synthase [Tepidisphaerales bacterium]
MIRLERLLANRGYCARSDVPGFLQAHDVRAAGVRLSRPAERVNPDAVTVDGVTIDPPTLVLVMNKPTGCTCSHRDAGPLVYDLLPQRYRRRDPPLATVGRLDKDTGGVLLLTDDGPLLHRLTSPKHHVPRVYVAELARPMTGSEAGVFASGTLTLEGDDKPLRPATLEPLGPATARVTLTEGRYHQVRRMFAAVGNHVVSLHRVAFGLLSADDLPAGAWRPLRRDELDLLTVATQRRDV